MKIKSDLATSKINWTQSETPRSSIRFPSRMFWSTLSKFCESMPTSSRKTVSTFTAGRDRNPTAPCQTNSKSFRRPTRIAMTTRNDSTVSSRTLSRMLFLSSNLTQPYKRFRDWRTTFWRASRKFETFFCLKNWRKSFRIRFQRKSFSPEVYSDGFTFRLEGNWILKLSVLRHNHKV